MENQHAVNADQGLDVRNKNHLLYVTVQDKPEIQGVGIVEPGPNPAQSLEMEEHQRLIVNPDPAGSVSGDVVIGHVPSRQVQALML